MKIRQVLQAFIVAVAGAASMMAPASASVSSPMVLHVPVLEYHRFLPPATDSIVKRGYDVTPAEFSDQLTALEKNGWHTITAAQLARDLSAGIRPPAKTFVITIDDGYADGFTDALPILAAHRMVATYYVVAGRIGKRKGADSSLTAHEIRRLVAAGMEIGNHTMHHVRLGGLRLRQQRQEIVSASQTLARVTGIRPLTMAYPFGSFTRRTEAIARQAGLVMAFDSVAGTREARTRLFDSPRLRVGPSLSGVRLVRVLNQLAR